jgi:hypothetical protein
MKSMLTPRLLAGIIIAGIFLVGSLVPAAPANAKRPVTEAVPAIIFGPTIEYSAVNRTTTSNYVNKSEILGHCLVVTAGMTCTITHGSESTRTVEVSIGATRGDVTASLSISNATSVSVSVGCTSPRLAKGAVYHGWALGQHIHYKLKEYAVSFTGSKTLVRTSGYLYAFNPYRNGLACGKA